MKPINKKKTQKKSLFSLDFNSFNTPSTLLNTFIIYLLYFIHFTPY